MHLVDLGSDDNSSSFQFRERWNHGSGMGRVRARFDNCCNGNSGAARSYKTGNVWMAFDYAVNTLDLNQWESLRFSENSLNFSQYGTTEKIQWG